jgi:hypothetical protein
MTTKQSIQAQPTLAQAHAIAHERAKVTGQVWPELVVKSVWQRRTHASQAQAPAPKPPKHVPVPVVGFTPKVRRVRVDGGAIEVLHVWAATVGVRGATTYRARLGAVAITLTQAQLTRVFEGQSVTVWFGIPAKAHKLVAA